MQFVATLIRAGLMHSKLDFLKGGYGLIWRGGRSPIRTRFQPSPSRSAASCALLNADTTRLTVLLETRNTEAIWVMVKAVDR